MKMSLVPKLRKAVLALTDYLAIQKNEALFEEYSTISFAHIADEILSKKEKILSLINKNHSPCYILDKGNLISSITKYIAAFKDQIPNIKHFYAVKLNHEPHLLKTIFAHGFGADVSSARELFLARDAGATRFLFSGPGKTKEELQKAIDSGLDVTINVDNFSELTRLIAIVTSPISIGVRVTFNEHGAWDKFGIPVDALEAFYEKCCSCPFIKITGIQFHISWNKNADTYISVINKLGNELSKPTLRSLVADLSFIDIGGGFRPFESEGFFPEDTAEGAIISAAAALLPDSPSEIETLPPYLLTESIEIESYAAAISTALKEHILSIKPFQIYSEPGRIIVNSAMHVAVSVVDIKSQECVITDGGTNIVGFERFEFDYFPLINLTHPSLEEREATVYGSLCMPQDYWGKRIFGKEFAEGDIIIIPYQGALTYSNMNDFIKGKADVFILE